MSAIYNEIDPYAAAWLENLIAAGHIEPGTVDRRSIEDLTPDDLKGKNQAHFFAGIGLWSYALRLAGWPANEPVWTGSCPCQPFSAAGKRKGKEDDRHLWPVWFRLIRESRPTTVFGEQVANRDWVDQVANDFESLGYSFGAAVLCASAFGAPRRRRLFFVAYTDREGKRNVAQHAKMAGLSTACKMVKSEWCEVRRMGALGDRSSSRMGRMRAIGNAIVPRVAAAFIRSALQAITEDRLDSSHAPCR